jgi:hypothetical protein
MAAIKFQLERIDLDEDKGTYTVTARASDGRISAEFTIGSEKYRYIYRSPKEREKAISELRTEARQATSSFCKRLAEHLGLSKG